MKYLTVQKNGIYKYRRAVPTVLRGVIGKKEVSESLKTKDRGVAAARYAVVDRRWTATFEAFRVPSTISAAERLKSLKTIAKLLDVTYVAASSKSDLTEQERFDDASSLATLWATLGKPKGEVFAAITGDEDEGDTITDYFDFFLQNETQKTLGLNDKEYKNKINPMRLWMKRFVEQHGNLTAARITPKIVNEFKLHLQEMINSEEIVNETAYKAGVCLRAIFRSKIDRLELGIKNPFKNLSFERGTAKRQTIPRSQIEDILLAKGYLDGLNSQAKALLLLMVNTGAHGKELIGLTKDDIRLDWDVPHIVLVPNNIRRIKTGYRKRVIPLLGVSLEAIKTFPNGFDRYQTDRGPDALSACLNKYLGGKGFFIGKQTVYSLRHGFKDRMREADFNDSMMDDLMGHRGVGPDYGDGYKLEKLAEKLIPVAL